MNALLMGACTPSPGRYAFDLAFDNVIKVAAVAHPSLLKVPEDLEVGHFSL
jgi:hypothetical protein